MHGAWNRHNTGKGTQEELFARTRETLLVVYRDEVAAIRASLALCAEQEQRGIVPHTSGTERERIIGVIHTQQAFDALRQGGVAADMDRAFVDYLTSFREDWDDALGTEPPFGLSDWLCGHLDTHANWTR